MNRTILAVAIGALLLGGGPAAAQVQARLAEARGHHAAGRMPEALAAAEAALREAETTGDELQVAEASLAVAGAQVALGRMGPAEEALKRAVEIRERRLGRDHRDTLQAMSEYAGWLTFQARNREAEVMLAHIAPALAAAATTPAQRAQAADARAGWAMNLFQLGRWDEGEREMKAALAILAERYDPSAPTEMAFMSVLGEAYFRWGRYDDARRVLNETLRLREERQGEEHPEIAGVLDKLATVHISLGEEAEAERLYRRQLEIVQKGYPDGGPLLAQALRNLALLYSVSGRGEDALPLFERAAQAEIKLDPTRWSLAETYREHALALVRLGRAAEAEPIAEKALRIYEINPGPESEDAAAARLALARVKFAAGKDDEAEAYGQSGLAIYQRVLSADNPRLGDALFQLGFAAQRRFDRETAARYYAEALAAMQPARPDHHEAVVYTRSSLAQQLLRGGEAARAYQLARRAADPLQERLIANARLIGRSGAPTVSPQDRNVFFIALRAGWAQAEALKPAP